MPTGFTHSIQKGISFRDFVLNCARNFGALIEFRDEPSGTVISEIPPKVFEHAEAKRLEGEMMAMRLMFFDEVREKAEAAYQEDLAAWKRRKEEAVVLEKKYRSMLVDVMAWNPPTPGHHGLKDFMRKQIEESIDFDCRFDQAEPMRPLPSEWCRQKYAALGKELEWQKKYDSEEEERHKGRVAWLKDLVGSLPKPEEKLDGGPPAKV